MHSNTDFESMLGTSTLNSSDSPRRNFLQTAIGVGFAAAALPVCAQTMIVTEKKGLIESAIEIDVQGQKVPLYYAMPEGKRNLPIVLVISEIFGVHEHIADVTRRFAHAGYLAIAPNLFIRQGDPNQFPVISDLIKEIISKTPDAQVMSDLDAIVAWASKNGGNQEQLAITGFCWGGRITWLYAAHNPQVKTGAAWYGRVVGKANDIQPYHPIDVANKIKAPILGLYGAKDNGIPLESLEQMKMALGATSRSLFKIYEQSGHAFHADYRPSYNKTDAQDAWQQCLTWFSTNLRK
jgi:carboxymethylenebutenolidase